MNTTLPYLLSRHAFTCVCGERVVILDLLSGHYLAVSGPSARALGGYVQGWPLRPSGAEEPSVLHEFEAAGLLTKDRRRGKYDASPVKATQGTESLADYPRCAALEIRFGHLVRFLFSAMLVPLVARFMKLRHIVAYLHRRKRYREDRSTDLESIAQLVDVFNYLLPIFYTNRDRCYRNSLMLLHFLSQYDVQTDWIFAVRGEPFRAHCWIQVDHVILNDYVAFTAPLTPVLIV